ncbi:MAG: YitT family protein [Lachnospiraceae bacterium]|nr:YitT family protein [Lachnospiraceae bacterium]
MKFSLKEDGKRLLVCCIASTIMALNIKSFVRTADLFPGGATGLTLLIQRAVEMWFDVTVPYTLVNVLINAVPIYIGFRYVGKKFTLFSCFNILLTSTLTDIIPGFVITYDTLLLSVFGGIINGCAISLSLMMNTSTGGTDFIGMYLSEKKGIDSWNLVLGINVVILSLAGILFGWDKALYSIIFQFVSTQMLHTLYTRHQQQTLFIVTNNAQDVCDAIVSLTNHGATVMDGIGSWEKQERQVVYSVVSRSEADKVLHAIRKADPNAFANSIRTEQLSGNFFRKPTE